MRKLRFRAWYIKEKRMLEPRDMVELMLDLYKWSEIIDHLILMQYTGQNDKNGKEIFEGDIVRAMRARRGKGRYPSIVGYDEIILEVLFNQERASFAFKNLKMNWEAYFGLEDSYEVIGNIYENPELRGVD